MDSAPVQWEEQESSTPDEEWAALQQVAYNTAKTYLGNPDRKHQDCFDPNDQALQTLMGRRDQAHQRVLQTRSTRSTTAAYKDACRLLRSTGHLMTMLPDRLPKQILYSELSSGHRKRGRPRLRFKDTIKRNLKHKDLNKDRLHGHHSHSREINGEQ
ncbi:hypothetical protein NP493_1457g00020 [Ridgeia piscesae]|uniref:Uncharacterized protein n=1 Tax=Ridgeia piscesae TaxID=27915 RepID=A0AAD9K2W7_RIDPI|nr:hypothetical protein NP493_1457g00020 [Ridgeia piscesae]